MTKYDILADTSIETDTTVSDVDSSCITLSISPNPAVTSITATVNTSNCGSQHLYQRIYRLYNGELIDSKQYTLISNCTNISTIDLTGQPAGFYYITVDNGSSEMVAKLFIKQ